MPSDAINADVFVTLCQDLQSSDQVRSGVKENGNVFVAVYDFINFVTNRPQFDHYAQSYWTRLTSNESTYSDELNMSSFLHKFGYKNYIPCMHLTGTFLYIFTYFYTLYFHIYRDFSNTKLYKKQCLSLTHFFTFRFDESSMDNG